MIFSIISAIGKNNEIGKKNGLLWNLPADMKHFRETTSGHTVVMGQKTFKSIGRPLPNRRNIVLSRNENLKIDGAEIIHSEKELTDLSQKTAAPDEEIFIIGGETIYRLFMDKADKLYITQVEAEFPEADAFFPEIKENEWQKVSEKKY